MEIEPVCITSKQIISEYADKNIYIWGTGDDAEALLSSVSESVSLSGYVDSYRNGSFFHGKYVLCEDELYDRWQEEDILIVASYKYGYEIIENLRKPLIAGENCFLFDDANVFHKDSVIDKYINFNREVWGKKRKWRRKNKILMPFFNKNDGMVAIYAFFANYAAEKYDAEIVGYSSGSIPHENVSPVMIDIYASINMSLLVEVELSESQNEEAERLLEHIWRGIQSWADWKEIEIYGICFGTTIVRDMCRFYYPKIDPNDLKNREIIKRCIETIVFWHDFFESNEIKMVFLKDGATWEGYIREIAVDRKIPVYALQGIEYYRLLGHDFYPESDCRYYKEFWEELTAEEKEYGIHWAKEKVARRLEGNTDEILYMNGKSVFSMKIQEKRIIEETENIKYLICPHVFGEDSFVCGDQIFDNNYLSWLLHLGELSEKTVNCDWYIKLHPNAGVRDRMIMEQLLNRFTKLKELPMMSSPKQLAKEGLNLVFTVYGSVGEEYSALGVPVINAGFSPNMAFHFTINPATKEEFDQIVLNFDPNKWEIDREELYRFYAFYYLYHNGRYPFFSDLFFQDPIAYADRVLMLQHGKDYGSWVYEEYMSEWTKEKQSALYKEVEIMLQEMNERKDNVFYRKNASRYSGYHSSIQSE